MNDEQAGAHLLRRSRGSFEVPVIGSTMDPTLREGDVVRVDANVGATVGDIVLVRDGGALLVHRVLKASEPLEGDNLITCGDANRARDPASPGRIVVGVVVSLRTAHGVTALDGGTGLANLVTAALLRASTRSAGWRLILRPPCRLWIWTRAALSGAKR